MAGDSVDDRRFLALMSSANTAPAVFGDDRTVKQVRLSAAARSFLGPIELGVLEELGDLEWRMAGRWVLRPSAPPQTPPCT